MNHDIAVTCPQCRAPIKLTNALAVFLKDIDSPVLPSTFWSHFPCGKCGQRTISITLQPDVEGMVIRTTLATPA